MNAKVDASRFPVGIDIDYDGAEAVEELKALEKDAWRFVAEVDWNPPLADMLLAFGVGPIIGLYLVRKEPGGKPEDAERWVVVGDLPRMHFETDDSPTPALALELYCGIAQDWADTVLAGEDIYECYPIEAAPTEEHANMLLSRIEFIRKELIPLAEPEPTH